MSPLVSTQRISLLPSPLKSPVPATDHVSGMVPTLVVLEFVGVVPFISQIATVPLLLLRHRMSAMPSPLKSPTPTTDQLVGTLPRPELLGFKIVVPFISQIDKSPVVSRHRMSAMPSPLKSPTPTTDQLVGTLPRPELLGFKIVVPFISQIDKSPAVSRQRMSAKPSPLKSRWPTIDQVV